MKRFVFLSLLVPLLLIISVGFYGGFVGMATKVPLVYKCVDNDATSSEPITTKGTVTVTTNAGGRNVYTDECVGKKRIREYSCNPNTKRQTYHEESCIYGQTCREGRCMDKWK